MREGGPSTSKANGAADRYCSATYNIEVEFVHAGTGSSPFGRDVLSYVGVYVNRSMANILALVFFSTVLGGNR
jgi:hypothetical protein